MTIRVYLDERGVDIPEGARASAAIQALDPELGAAIADGRAYLTDGRGIALAADAQLEAGAILRVVRSARRAAGPGDE